MTDKELLEYSAKAAGIIFDEDSKVLVGDCRYDWNPLTDDGDALRLAVKLRLFINILDDDWTVARWDDFDNSIVNDKCTRRAIVRAAAEIGKEIK